MSNNIICASMIILWIIISLLTGILTIISCILLFIILIIIFLVLLSFDFINKQRIRSQNKVEINKIHNQRVISLDSSKNDIIDLNDRTEEYFISKINPKYVYYHNKNNDSITILNRDNGNLWLIQPSNRNPEYAKYKLKYQKFEQTIDIVENNIRNNSEYLKNKGILLTENYYNQQDKLPGNYT